MSKHPYYVKLMNSKEWKALRLRKLRADPLCEDCLGSTGRSTPAREVHHIVPVETGVTEALMYGLAYNWNNLRSLCHKCHVHTHIDLASKSKVAIKAANDAKTENFLKTFLGG